MPSIDNRVVSMQFDNAQFERNLATTKQSLKDLNKSLQLNGASDALNGVSAAASAMPLTGIAAGVESIASKFSLLGAIGFTVIQELTRGFLSVGRGLYNAIATPIIEGGKARALSIEQAKFQFKGLGMDVQATMDDAMYAVKDTAYALDEAATAASMLGASGVRAGTVMKASLRGISGMAAISGQPYSRIADIMTSVAGQGRVTGDTLFRLGQVGVNAAAILAKEFGTTEAKVRDMVTHGEVDFKTFAVVMDKAFGPHAKEANKTYQGALANTMTALKRLGAVFYGGPPSGPNKGMNEAMRIGLLALIPVIDDITTAVTPFLILITNGMKDAAISLSKYLAVFKTSEGIEAFGHLSQALITIFYGFMSVLEPVRKAFLEVFPVKTFKDFHDFAVSIQELASKMFPTKALIEHITIAFKGLFSIFSLSGKIIKFIAEALYSVFDILFVSTGILGGFGDGLGSVSDTIFGFFTDLNSGKDTTKFFTDGITSLRGALEQIASPFKTVGGWIGEFVGWLEKLTGGFEPVQGKMSGVAKVAEFFSEVIKGVAKVLGTLVDILKPVTEGIGRAIKGMSVADIILVIFSASALANVSNFFSRIIVIFSNFLPQFSGITFQFKIMMTTLSAQLNMQSLKQFAISLLILAGALFVISMIDPERLTTAMQAVVIAVTLMLGVMSMFNKMEGGFKGIFTATISMNLLSGALLLMAASILIFGNMKPEALSQGLLAVVILMTLMIGIMEVFSKIDGGLKSILKATIAMNLLSASLILMAVPIMMLGNMKPEALTQGLLAIIIMMITMIGVVEMFKKEKDSDMLKVATNMMILSSSIAILAGALKLMGSMNIMQLGLGLGAMAIGLGLMVGAMRILPDNIAVKAVSLLIVSAAIFILAKALQQMSTIAGDAMVVALVGLSLALAIVTIFLESAADPKMLVGAAALLVISVALTVLANVLKMIGAMSPEAIATALVTIALALGIIAIAGYLLEAALPGLLGLGAAILLIGMGVFLAAAGIGLLVVGFAMLAAALSTGGMAIVTVFIALSAALPLIALNIAKAIGAFALGLIDQQKELTAGLVSLFTVVLDALTEIVPKILTFLGTLITGILTLLVTKIPEIVAAILLLVTKLLDAFATAIPGIALKAADLMVAFINGMSQYYDRIITAGANFIIKLIQGIAKNMVRIADEGMKTVIKFLNGLTASVKKNGKAFSTAAKGLVNALFDAMLEAVGLKDFWKIGKNIIDGLGQGITDFLSGPIKIVKDLIGSLATAARAAGIIESPSKLFAVIGGLLVDGLSVGMKNASGSAEDAAKRVINATYSALQAANDAANNVLIGLESPTITPVIDLDAVYAGAKTISTLMSGTSAMKVSAMVDSRMNPTSNTTSSTTDAVNKNSDVTFNQYNTSPKSLSRLEIYRQTRNQLQSLKGLGV